MLLLVATCNNNHRALFGDEANDEGISSVLNNYANFCNCRDPILIN